MFKWWLRNKNTPSSKIGSVYSSECSSEEVISEDIGDDSEPDDSAKNERESSIYPGSTFTNGNFDALLLAFFKKLHISESAKEDLLKLLELTLPDGNNTATSSYMFNKRHRDCLLSYSLIELCPKCHKKVEKELCNNDDCEDKGVKIDPLRFFVLPLKPQIQRLIQGRKPTIIVFLFGFHFSFWPGSSAGLLFRKLIGIIPGGGGGSSQKFRIYVCRLES